MEKCSQQTVRRALRSCSRNNPVYPALAGALGSNKNAGRLSGAPSCWRLRDMSSSGCLHSWGSENTWTSLLSLKEGVTECFTPDLTELFRSCRDLWRIHSFHQGWELEEPGAWGAGGAASCGEHLGTDPVPAEGNAAAGSSTPTPGE